MLIRSIIAFMALLGVPAHASQFAKPEPVQIEGYTGHAMEPFLSRDDRFLLFNNSNNPRVNTDLYWAERITPLRFRFRGKIVGVNTRELEGVPSLDRSGNIYFVSTRSYGRSLSTIYRGTFTNGRVTRVQLVEGLSLKRKGLLNFDAEISPDGEYLYAVDGVFTGGPVPKAANIIVARRIGNRFERLANSQEIMANINTSALEYAPAVSVNELELFFTRMSGVLFWRKLKIMHATRTSREDPFGNPEVIKAISGVVEAPTISRDGRSLYYHKKVDGVHRIYRVSQP